MTNFFEEVEIAKKDLKLESFELNVKDMDRFDENLAKFKEVTDTNVAIILTRFKEMDFSAARNLAEFEEMAYVIRMRYEAYKNCINNAFDSYIDNIKAVCGEDTLDDCPIAGDFSKYHADLDACA